MSDKEKDLNQEDENINEENQDSSEDSFGLPDLDYEPLESEESTEEDTSDGTEEEEYEESFESGEVPDDEVTTTPSYMEEDESKAPIIIGIIAIVIIVVGALGYFLGWFDGLFGGGEPEPQLTEQVQEPEPDPEPAVEEPEPVVEEEPVEPVVEEVEPVAGEIRTITAPTSRYYVVLSSSIDDDLAMDRAKELSEEGINTAIIEPSGDLMFYRLTIGEDFGTWQEAQNRANELKATYGDELWVLKY